jgi:hypothetical protein
MNRFLRHIVLLFAVLLLQPSAGGVLHAKTAAVVKIDSSNVQAREPDKTLQRDVYTSDDYVYDRRVKEEGSNWFTDFLKWIAEQFRFNPTPVDVPEGSGKMAQVIILILAAGLLVLLVLLLTKTNIRSVFRKKKIKEEADTGDSEITDVNIHGVDFKTRITEAVRIGDYRTAVRLHFLSILKQLSDKEKINWRIDKTNHDYYLELSGSEYQQEFFETAFMYEYVWYGDFKITEGEYQLTEDKFKQTAAHIGRA